MMVWVGVERYMGRHTLLSVSTFIITLLLNNNVLTPN